MAHRSRNAAIFRPSRWHGVRFAAGMNIARRGLLPLLLGTAFLATACGGGTYTPRQTDDPDDPLDPRADNGFESDDPQLQSGRVGRGGSADAGTAAPSAGGDESAGNGDGAARAIEEADIVKVEGNRLYALSRYGGLAIIDTSNPDQLRLVGRKRLDGVPFEMYLRGSRAYVMLTDFGRYEASNGGRSGRWVQTSEMLAIDLTNETALEEIAHYDIPGSIADSRLVGDAIYVVTNEDGYCWGCQQNQGGAVVTSFDIAGAGIAKVDQLSYRTPNNGYAYQRSVSATNERLYIGGPTYDWSPGAQGGHSIIQVVDIHDPHGAIKKGADVPVAGQIQSRWQMDEADGILRVVSQNGNGWGNGINPLVQTFTVTNASTITPLGSTELILPAPESLRSVRFDGTRGYAITAEQSDPLFTIDLSDPAHPRQAGELHMPGWITHMEPRGDRLVGFGFAETNWSSKLAVSLFDVTDLDSPVMLERVEFGTGGGQYAEDSDRIHKSVQVLDEKGLILVPFASYGSWNDGACSKPQSGIQLIDYSHDHITARGIAPQYGQPRRALLANDRLLAMSDRNVTSFDISKHDAPTKTSELDLSNPAFRLTRVGDQIASITNDWWTSEVMLSLTPYEGADDAAVSGKLSLASLADQTPESCSGNASSWAQWYSARLFVMGNQVVVSVPVWSYANEKPSMKLVFGVVDASNPLDPKLVSKTSVQLGDDSYGSYGGGMGFFDGFGYYSYYGGSLLSDGESMVQVGNKLAYLDNQWEYLEQKDAMGNPTYETRVHRKLHVVDFSTAAPAVATPIVLGDSKGTFPLIVRGTEVLTSRWRESPTTAGKVKFYVDRIDLAGDAPVREVSVNTPGSLLLSDDETGRIVTVDYTRSVLPAADYAQCYENGVGGVRWFDYEHNQCSLITRQFKLSDLQNDTVTLRNTFTPPSQQLGGLKIADDRIYVTHYPVYDYDAAMTRDGQMPAPIHQGGLFVLGGIRAGTLAMQSQLTGDAQWPLAARGNKVALYTQRGLAIYDTATPSATLVTEQTLRGWGYTSDVLFEQDRAICSLGEWGMQTIRVP